MTTDTRPDVIEQQARQQLQLDQTLTARQTLAAVNSYRKHFGTHAVAAAEGDWIGRAIEEVRANAGILIALSHQLGETYQGSMLKQVESIRALLAEVQR